MICNICRGEERKKHLENEEEDEEFDFERRQWRSVLAVGIFGEQGKALLTTRKGNW
jgi:hypothetical protein